MKGASQYLMLGDLLLQFGCLGASGLRVGQTLLCGSQPIRQGLQCFMELLSHHQDAVQLLVSVWGKNKTVYLYVTYYTVCIASV